ncbi:hypothetical protein PG995_000296 [Apiospora arundinis]
MRVNGAVVDDGFLLLSPRNDADVLHINTDILETANGLASLALLVVAVVVPLDILPVHVEVDGAGRVEGAPADAVEGPRVGLRGGVAALVQGHLGAPVDVVAGARGVVEAGHGLSVVWGLGLREEAGSGGGGGEESRGAHYGYYDPGLASRPLGTRSLGY